MREMLSYMSVGHMFVSAPPPQTPHVSVGLLGADYRIENDRFRFAKIYDGENWNPGVQAPLTQPGTDVKAGEYLLAVNGRNVTAAENVYSFFEGTADKLHAHGKTGAGEAVGIDSRAEGIDIAAVRPTPGRFGFRPQAKRLLEELKELTRPEQRGEGLVRPGAQFLGEGARGGGTVGLTVSSAAHPTQASRSGP